MPVKRNRKWIKSTPLHFYQAQQKCKSLFRKEKKKINKLKSFQSIFELNLNKMKIGSQFKVKALSKINGAKI